MRIEQNEDVMTVYLSGELDHHSARQMRETIDLQITLQSPKKLLLDFGKVAFMDSSGIGLVMGRYKKMQEIGGSIRVVNCSELIRRIMLLAGLDRLQILS